MDRVARETDRDKLSQLHTRRELFLSVMCNNGPTDEKSNFWV